MEVETVVQPPVSSTDPNQPISKKSKSRQEEPTTSSEEGTSNGDADMQETQPTLSWGQSTFAETLCRGGGFTRPSHLNLYMGEDDDQNLSRFEEICEMDQGDIEGSNSGSLVVPISPEKYHSPFQPWRGALVLKLLGKTVTFKLLDQRTRSLWYLQNGYELIDLEGGFYLARFYSREDYFRVLEEGPWIIMGHYLTVMK